MSITSQLDALFDTPPGEIVFETKPQQLATSEGVSFELPKLSATIAEQCRRKLARFIKEAWKVIEPENELLWNWHIDVIANYVQELLESWAEKRPSRNGVINIPPGTAKSRIVSVLAPAWAWIHWPHLTMRCMSSNPRVAERDGAFMRDLVTSDWYRQMFKVEWGINPEFDAKGLFKNTAGGARYSQGLNAKVTGERTDIQILDDPHDAEEALSEAKRVSVIQRYKLSVWNRVNDSRYAVRIGVMQRLHEEDWAAWAIEKGFETLCLPMEYDPDHPHVDPRDPRFVKGECLHPERFTPEVLAQEKKTLGPFGVAGQLQQRPSPEDGGMFKRKYWRYWRPDGAFTPKNARDKLGSTGPAIIAPDFFQIVISVDAAFAKTETSDRVAFLVGARGLGTERYIIEVVAERMTFSETVDKLLELNEKYPKALWKLIEKKANGDAIIDTLYGKVSGLIPINPEGGKVARAHACLPAIAAGEVYLLEGEPWVEELVGETAAFPNGKHDDIVDALTQFMNYLSGDDTIANAIGLGNW